MDLPLDTQLVIAGTAILLLGALAGSAGYAAIFGGRQLRRSPT
jgi:hypothetical protein